MVKNSFISVTSQEEKKENRGSVEFQVVSFTNDTKTYFTFEIGTKKTIYLREVYGKFKGKRQRLLAYLSKKNRVRYKEIIGQLDIREIKTR
uniref:Small ribosomal subunit protein uS15c n=1 Tax=Ilex szechwanensis TaxID=1872703 RepID=A0A1B1NHI1_9AQUA|nr:30S ribosomal protein S15 [Ilex szechwanensis]